MFDKEFYDESISKNTKLLIVNNNETESYFSNFLSKYLSKNKRRIIGFDIEFNTPPGSHNERVIAIFQIAFYFKKYVLVIFFNPLLVNNNTNRLITKLLTSQNIHKIGHGTDSLDVPAIYNYLSNTDDIIAFTNTLYDTRFLCEFTNVITGERLCNIYHLIDKYKVVKPEQMEWLKVNEKKLGDFWRKKIDINNLSPELRDYSMYDALYLKKLIILMKKDFTKSNYDFNLIIQATRLVFLLKREIIKLDDFSYLNICFLSNKKKLYDYFNEVFLKFNQDILKIGYFKNQLIKILQLVFYIQICKNNPVYKSSNTLIDKTDIDKLEIILNKFNVYLKFFPKINKLINNFLYKL
jgi:hypothetical protein